MFRQLLETLRLAIEGRTGASGTPSASDLGPVIELPNKDWVIETDGMHSLHNFYYISDGQALADETDWRGHMSDKTWVNPETFDEAFTTAVALFEHTRKAEGEASR